MRRLLATAVAALGFVFVMAAQAAPVLPPQPTQAEMRTKRQWVDRRLLECRFAPAEAAPAAPLGVTSALGLTVLANNDPVIRNGRGGRPLRLGDTSYTRGLYCHAVSKVVVRLPGPGKTFSAVVGLDHNDDTARGRGSVVFSVTVAGKVAFRSDVMRVDTPARPVTVDLGGADTFVLEVGNAGDGIGWDQSDWADAKAALADGTEVWLGDLPLADLRSEAPAILPLRTSDLPLVFVYGRRSSDDLLPRWSRKAETRRLDEARTQHTLTWTDPDTGLEVRCVAVEYADFPALEWTATFTNTGRQDTPTLENVQGLDVQIACPPDGSCVLHHWRGDTCSPDLYQPLEAALGPGVFRRFAPAGGRGTNGAFPYYRLVTPGGGLLIAVGWPGQWATMFARDAGGALRVSAGQEKTHLVLRPGERIRTPLIALVFVEGDDPVRAQNVWRRWMWAHNVPRNADGRLPEPILFGNTSSQFNEMINANEENQKHFIDRYVEERIGIDHWWMDAGWYPCDGHWPKTGTWEPDPKRFPRGLRAISDHGRASGVKTLVWFEPERVAGGTWLAMNHPEWLLGGTVLNLGNPDARAWLTDHVDRTLREQGIDLYRQDFNMDPLGYWRAADAPDRQGITENLHVQGYLAYWDALRERHPNLVIDSCASGGRRNDLETMRRAIPLHPTDFDYGNLPVKQAFHYSLFQWIPCYGSNTVPVGAVDAYAFRSGHAANIVLGYDMRNKNLDYALLRRLAAEWRRVVACYRGDFYPLTPYNRDETAWIAWQFHRADTGEGVVEAFRRAACEDGAKTFRLGGLDPAARYEVTDPDTGTTAAIAGRALMDEGLSVEIRARPGAATVVYRRLDAAGRQP